MSEVIFDIFNDFNLVQGHKSATVARKGKEIHVNYKGDQNSAGFRTSLQTVKGYWYRLNLHANLLCGDMGFIYCESINPPTRIVERKHFITKNINQCKISFQAISSRTYLGVLFYNSGEYKLVIKRFRVEAQNSPFETINTDKNSANTIPINILNNIKKNYQHVQQEEQELQQIIQKNHQLVQDMLRASHQAHIKPNNNNLLELSDDESIEENLEDREELPQQVKKISQLCLTDSNSYDEHSVSEKIVVSNKDVEKSCKKSSKNSDKLIVEKLIEDFEKSDKPVEKSSEQIESPNTHISIIQNSHVMKLFYPDIKNDKKLDENDAKITENDKNLKNDDKVDENNEKVSENKGNNEQLIGIKSSESSESSENENDNKLSLRESFKESLNFLPIPTVDLVMQEFDKLSSLQK